MTLLAKDIMTTDIITVPADLPLRDAAVLFAEAGISGAPVVDAQKFIVGVISEKDLLEQAQSHTSLPRLTLSRFGFEDLPPKLLQSAYADGLARTVSEVMSFPVITADENAGVEKLADLMVVHRVNRIPIVRENRPVGIVTREDVLRAIAGMVHEETDPGTPGDAPAARALPGGPGTTPDPNAENRS